MLTQNGQIICLQGNRLQIVPASSFNESEILNPLNNQEVEFMDSLKFEGIEDLISSLKMIHDFALYHSDVCLDTEEKTALFNLKVLWERLEVLKKSLV